MEEAGSIAYNGWPVSAVTVQDLNCGHMSGSRCKNHYKAVLGAEAKVEDPPTGGYEPNEVSSA